MLRIIAFLLMLAMATAIVICAGAAFVVSYRLNLADRRDSEDF